MMLHALSKRLKGRKERKKERSVKQRGLIKTEGLPRQQDRRGNRRSVKQRCLIKTRDSQGSEKGEKKGRPSKAKAIIKTRDSQGSEKGEEGEIRKAKAIDKDEGLSRQQDRRGKKGRFVKQR